MRRSNRGFRRRIVVSAAADEVTRPALDVALDFCVEIRGICPQISLRSIRATDYRRRGGHGARSQRVTAAYYPAPLPVLRASHGPCHALLLRCITPIAATELLQKLHQGR